HHLPQPIPHTEGNGPVRPRARGRVLADLLPHHPAAVLHPLQLDAARGHRRQDGGDGMSAVPMPATAAVRGARAAPRARIQKRTIFLVCYLVFAVLPIYWMVMMSFKTNEEILSSFTLWPHTFTWANYKTIFTDESWYSGYINSLIYVAINTVISLVLALPPPYPS